jgi:hypothetical protein
MVVRADLKHFKKKGFTDRSDTTFDFSKDSTDSKHSIVFDKKIAYKILIKVSNSARCQDVQLT